MGELAAIFNTMNYTTEFLNCVLEYRKSYNSSEDHVRPMLVKKRTSHFLQIDEVKNLMETPEHVNYEFDECPKLSKNIG